MLIFTLAVCLMDVKTTAPHNKETSIPPCVRFMPKTMHSIIWDDILKR